MHTIHSEKYFQCWSQYSVLCSPDEQPSSVGRAKSNRLWSIRRNVSFQRIEMKLICDGPTEHLKLAQKICTTSPSTTGDPQHQHSHQKYQYHQLSKATDTDTEDELKAPLLSINQRLNDVFVSSSGGGGGSDHRRYLSSNIRPAAELQQLPSYAPRHKYCPFPSRRDINHRLSIWYALIWIGLSGIELGRRAEHRCLFLPCRDGDIGLLQVDAISTNTANAEQALTVVGKQQLQQQQQQHQCGGSGSHCETGEIQVTPPGFQLSAKYILHNVCPVFREKCRTQSSTLFSCYR